MDLYYEIQGQGEAIVLIHSPGADLREWQFIALELAKSYQVIAFDGRGAGRSPSPIKSANYVEDLRKLLAYLNINQAVLVGHSMGGQIVTEEAGGRGQGADHMPTLTHPQEVSRLIIEFINE